MLPRVEVLHAEDIADNRGTCSVRPHCAPKEVDGALPNCPESGANQRAHHRNDGLSGPCAVVLAHLAPLPAHQACSRGAEGAEDSKWRRGAQAWWMVASRAQSVPVES